MKQSSSLVRIQDVSSINGCYTFQQRDCDMEHELPKKIEAVQYVSALLDGVVN